MTQRYEWQTKNPDNPSEFRIADTFKDHRIATCYRRDMADLVVNALNAYQPLPPGIFEKPVEPSLPRLDRLCTYVIASTGSAYPRTCKSCALGPCKNAINEGTFEQRVEKAKALLSVNVNSTLGSRS